MLFPTLIYNRKQVEEYNDLNEFCKLAIFIVISNTFVDGGFGSALIQKKEPTQQDYSTIFWWNLFVSFVLYLVKGFSNISSLICLTFSIFSFLHKVLI